MSRSPTLSRSSIRVPRYASGPKKKVWLTFDDGPHPSHTDQVLKTLDQFQIKATFFVVGENVVRLPKIVQRTFDAGHRIANHTYTHPHLPKLSKAAIRKEIEDTERLISNYQVSGKLLRPPYGAHNATVDAIAAELGYRLKFWSVDTLDWNAQYQPDGWVQHGIEQIRTRDESVVLNHDIHKTTAENLGDFIRRIIDLGTVSFEPPSTI
jgi:peptidoglycan/xylan/chitin deacetylase (PgdA/CDA1 family)